MLGRRGPQLPPHLHHPHVYPAALAHHVMAPPHWGGGGGGYHGMPAGMSAAAARIARMSAAGHELGPNDYEALLALDDAAAEEEAERHAEANEAKLSTLLTIPMPDMRRARAGSGGGGGGGGGASSGSGGGSSGGGNSGGGGGSSGGGKSGGGSSGGGSSSGGVAAARTESDTTVLEDDSEVVVGEDDEDDADVVDLTASHTTAPPRAAASKNEECAVCMEDMPVGSTVKLLPACFHKFHPSCIDPWVRINPVCPVCKTAI